MRSRVLRPSDRLRYAPGSLLLIVGAAAAEPDRFAEQVVDERSSVLSLEKVRALLAGKIADDEIEAKARELLDAAVQKRLQAGQTVVVPIHGFDPGERERYVRLAHGQRRPRHLILLEAPRAQIQDDERPGLDELRRALDANELGKEGFATVLRLGGNALGDLKRIVFQAPSRDD